MHIVDTVGQSDKVTTASYLIQKGNSRGSTSRRKHDSYERTVLSRSGGAIGNDGAAKHRGS